MFRYDPSLRQNANFAPYKDKPWLINLNSHCLIVGMTGTGKSNYLRLILDHLDREECNVVLMDPHGEVSDYALMKSSKNKIFLSGSHYEGAEGFYSGINVLKTSKDELEPNIITDWLKHAFSSDDALSKGTWGPRLETVFSGILTELMRRKKGLNLKEFASILTDRKEILSFFHPGEQSPALDLVKNYASNARAWSDFIMSTMHKIIPILSNPLTSRVISADDASAFDLDAAIIGKNNLIVPELNLGITGEGSVKVISTLLLARIWSALNGRGPSSERTYILIDEAHLIPEQVLRAMLAQGRKFGVVLVLLYQSFSQNSEQFTNLLAANIRNYAFFNLSLEDTEEAVRMLRINSMEKHPVDTLLRQRIHNVTVACEPDKSNPNIAFGWEQRYGPITVTPPLVPINFTEKEVLEVKAGILRKIGYKEVDQKRSLDPENEIHNRLMYLFADFLGSMGIQVTIEPNVGDLIPDLLIEYKGKIIYCEVEDSDLDHPPRVAEKMWNYRNSNFILLCREADFLKLIRMISNMMDSRLLDQSYNTESKEIPRSGLPVSLFHAVIATYGGGKFRAYNGSKLLEFKKEHLEMTSSFASRARGLTMGILRESVLRYLCQSIEKSGRIDLDDMESGLDRKEIRELLKAIQDQGYDDPYSINALLELDRIQD